MRPSSLGSSYLSPVLRPEAVCFFNLVCRRHVSSGLVGLVEPTGDMCPGVIRTLLLPRLTIRANDWTGRDSATFATVCKFDVCVGRTNAIHSISQALIRNSKGRASRITLDTWQSEASCYLRIPQEGNSASPSSPRAKSETNLAPCPIFCSRGSRPAADIPLCSALHILCFWESSMPCRVAETLTGSP